MTIPGRDPDVIDGGFPHQRYKPSKPRPTSTECLDTVTQTVNQARSLPTVTVQKLSEVQNACGVRGRTELHEWVSTMNENENHQEGRPTGLRTGGKVA